MMTILIFVSIIWSSYQSVGAARYSTSISKIGSRTFVRYNIKFGGSIGDLTIFAQFYDDDDIQLVGSDNNGIVCEGLTRTNIGESKTVTCDKKLNLQSNNGFVRLEIHCLTGADCTHVNLYVYADVIHGVTKVPSITKNVGFMRSSTQLMYFIKIAGHIGGFEINATSEQGVVKMVGSDDNGDVCEGSSTTVRRTGTCVLKDNLQSIEGVVHLNVSCLTGSYCYKVQLIVSAEVIHNVAKVRSITTDIGSMKSLTSQTFRVIFKGSMSLLDIKAHHNGNEGVRLDGGYLGKYANVCYGSSNKNPVTCALRPDMKSKTSITQADVTLTVTCLWQNCNSVKLVVFAPGLWTVTEK